MIQPKVIPLNRMFFTGTFLENSTKEEASPWFDCLGMDEGVVLFRGMEDGLDEVIIEGSIVAKPDDDTAELVSKEFKSNGNCRIKGYWKYRARHVVASGKPVTVYLFGSN